MNKSRTLPLDEREVIAAESDPEFLKELERRADDAIDHPERAISAADSIARARAAVAAVRAQRKP